MFCNMFFASKKKPTKNTGVSNKNPVFVEKYNIAKHDTSTPSVTNSIHSSKSNCVSSYNFEFYENSGVIVYG